MPTLEALPAAPEPERRHPEIVRLMKRLPHGNILRRYISAAYGSPFYLPETVPALLKVLRDSGEVQWRERLVAILALRDADILPEHRMETAVVLGRIMNSKDTSKITRLMRRSLRTVIMVAAWLFLIIGLRGTMARLGIPHLLPENLLYLIDFFTFVALLFTPLLLVLSPLYDSVKAKQVRDAATETLARLKLPESAGALAETARGTSARAARAYSALREVLPTLTAQHYGQLPADTTPELCALLENGRWDSYEAFTGTPVKEMLLEALGKVGDGRAVLPVERFARSANSSELREQAERILPILQQRAEQERNAGILLRGSSAPEAKPVELLRAASYTSTTEPDQLLRATLGPNSEPNA